MGASLGYCKLKEIIFQVLFFACIWNFGFLEFSIGRINSGLVDFFIDKRKKACHNPTRGLLAQLVRAERS